MTAQDGTGALIQRHLVLPSAATSPGAARSAVRDVLAAAGRPEWVDSAEVAVSELVTNAALHAHTKAEVSVTVYAGCLRVEVRDFSPVLPSQKDYDGQATTGRGMALVAALTSSCGVTSLPDGKAVWFILNATATDPSDDDLLALWNDADWDVRDLEAGAPAPVEPDTGQVELRSLPTTLWLAAREHHDALLRELVLYLAEHDDVHVDLVSADRARGTISAAVSAALEDARRSGTARRVLPLGHPSPLPDAPPTIDLPLMLPRDMGPAFAALQDAVDAAERLAVAGKLLIRPGLPEIIALGDWASEQVQSQLNGVAPNPWPGSDQERFETASHGPVDDPDWNLSDVLASGRGVVAADDANRIIGISDRLADFLGWRPEDLIGRRVVALIPPALREAHVAGFTRHLTTGEAHVLGVPLTLPVLHASGREITCRFLVEQPLAEGGRSIYLAWIEPCVDSADDCVGAPED